MLQNDELKAAFALLQQLWNKNYQVICQTQQCVAQSQKASCSLALQGVWPALTSCQWSKSAEPLVHAIARKQQQNAIQLVSCAYSSIQPARLAALTGSTSQEVLQSKLASLAMHRATMWSIWHN